jgi:hypothetical protein
VLVYINGLGTGGALAEVTTHPYPALGGSILGATDRGLCPQVNDTYAATLDSYSILRAVLLPPAGTTRYLIGGLLPGDGVNVILSADGAVALWDWEDGAWEQTLVSAAAGTIVEGDDFAMVLEGLNVNALVNGVSVGTSAAADLRVEQVGEFYLDAGGGGDALELWPLYVTLPFKL